MRFCSIVTHLAGIKKSVNFSHMLNSAINFASPEELFAVRRCFGFNWRVVLLHDQKLDEFGCSGEQPSSFVPARPKFFGIAELCPPEKPFAICHSPFATRYSPSFGLSRTCDQDL